NVVGDREIPDHPLVRQTLYDCLHEAMDVEGLVRLLEALEGGRIQTLPCDLPHPSPLAAEILTARPYAYLDDAPLEERRTQAVASRRWLDPETAAQFGRLDPAAIEAVRQQARPSLANAEELHDALMLLGVMSPDEDGGGADRAAGDQPSEVAPLELAFEQLQQQRRATRLHTPQRTFWVAAEQLPLARAIYADARAEPALAVPAEYAARQWERSEALRELLRGRMSASGPITLGALSRLLHLPPAALATALTMLEAEGFVLRGRFSPQTEAPPRAAAAGGAAGGAGAAAASAELEAVETVEWCERRLLARIHRFTLNSLRAEIEPVSSAEFMRFLLEWQGVTRDPRPEGSASLAAAIAQLEGFALPAAAWEADVLPVRLRDYDPAGLDALCLSGRVLWARLAAPAAGGSGPVRATPIALLTRANLPLWQRLMPPAAGAALSAPADTLVSYLQRHGASFFEELAAGSGLLASQAESALGELVSSGWVTADSFAGLRALILPLQRKRKLAARSRTHSFGLAEAGRWSVLPRRAEVNAEAALSPGPGGAALAEDLESVAWLLLRRYGVVFRRLLTREAEWLPPWHALLRSFRRLEAQGHIRGGRFVAGATGEQYALPEAVTVLRAVRRREPRGELVALSAADPLNLTGIVTPGTRIAALAGNRVLLRDGVAVATHTGGEVQWLDESLPASQQWQARTLLLRPARSAARRIA
ncbi:MAG TPA: hypothetical protein VL994_05095, partial [Steroidobacteraceae bacterium]|nr:hypothetical protein [Steroidobacteraceae bacterium]